MGETIIVKSFLDKREVFAKRLSNRTILIDKTTKMIDSDQAMIEDKYGHRYSRNISLETTLETTSFIFEMI